MSRVTPEELLATQRTGKRVFGNSDRALALLQIKITAFGRTSGGYKHSGSHFPAELPGNLSIIHQGIFQAVVQHTVCQGQINSWPLIANHSLAGEEFVRNLTLPSGALEGFE